ncbi:DegQ family serine endoprotease [Methylomarinum sp. Ch1-1]|uniref:DegQ family serine endoprotease n=1 Tax=Methylomarinum roseum TaxID=3067653 RepID=A0AAU7NWG1_9GAMM|nr:DegQ family serine endoprotease [Methylomarinum sp. Ch1-1]MDP4522610.1 DegQ family serine endoprotease [Methylomarinum sp. Ch1-1]
MFFAHRVLILCITLFSVTAANAALPNYDSSGRPVPSISPMLKQVNPAVVNISTFSTREVYNPLLNDPFFRHFFQIPEQPRYQPKRRQQSAGSGVIVNKDEGIVLTNFHVINNADEVYVSLIDGRDFKAEVVGEDRDLDIAVLKIKASNLTEVKIGRSSLLEVGDFVVAIGNPFGLGQTVTTGVVSALERSGLGIEGYENFIQTDASINPGNSGGALVNLLGELVGINTAIIAPSGGNIGIGFAIPIDMVNASMRQILAFGEVRRGMIGVNIQDITSDLRKAFDLKHGQQGVLVTGVIEGGGADKAGLKAGDVIISVDDQMTRSTGRLRSMIAVKAIGDELTLGVIRDGKERKFSVEIQKPKAVAASEHALLQGVKLENTPNNEGVIITAIAPNSMAAYSGLRPGDIITGANRKRVSDIDSLRKALSRTDKELLLHINRSGRFFYLIIR